MLLGLNNLVEKIKKGYEQVAKWRKEHPDYVGKIPNPFECYGYIHVYTTETFFESPYCNVMVDDYVDLNESYVKWIEETQLKLLANRTFHEKKFSKILSQSNTKIVEQPYFKINEKGYFLDFYLPQYHLAFELNGKVHKGEESEWYDAERDFAFHKIGIKTIRLSNLDIKSNDIKAKINAWANAALSGNFDPALYYKRSATKKFEGKDTKYENLHKLINATIGKKKYVGKSILLITDETYFSYVLKNERYDTSDKANESLIDEFFNTIENNNINFGVWFSGKMGNMSDGKKQAFIKRNNEMTKEKIDYIIRLKGNEITEEKYPYSKVRPIQNATFKDKNGKTYYSTECPYDMFLPFKKNGARKRKFRTQHVCVNSHTCNLCKYFKGENEEKRIVFCKGFENEGSKNIYDNLSLNSKDMAEEYRQRLAYKETIEYKCLVRSIEAKERMKSLNEKENKYGSKSSL